MTPGPVAFIADVHGNIWALDAVLGDLRRRGITTIFNLGDSVYGPLEPALTADRLLEMNIPSLRGNQDRVLVMPPPVAPHPTFGYTMSCLRARHFEWLRQQPCTIEYADYFLCHGTPSSDEVYLTESVSASGVELRRASEIEQLVDGVTQRFVLCGHSHVARVIGLGGGRFIVNPGSAGLPAYSDDVPFPHRMETGSGHARYAVVEAGRVELIAVQYETGPAVAKARRNGREDWAVAIETGFTTA